MGEMKVKVSNARWLICILVFIITIACLPEAGEISGATSKEIRSACSSLKRVGYDYWRLDVLSTGGRIVEVAADIHTSHPGPQKTRAYCEGR